MASEEPTNVVERAADAAMDAARDLLEKEGMILETIFVSLTTDGPGDESACTSAGGDAIPADPGDRAKLLLSFLLAAAEAVGGQIGVRISVVPIGKG